MDVGTDLLKDAPPIEVTPTNKKPDRSFIFIYMLSHVGKFNVFPLIITYCLQNESLITKTVLLHNKSQILFNTYTISVLVL